MSATSLDGKSFSDISAITAAFTLQGGLYGVDVTGTFGGGSVKLQRQCGDGLDLCFGLDVDRLHGRGPRYRRAISRRPSADGNDRDRRLCKYSEDPAMTAEEKAEFETHVAPAIEHMLAQAKRQIADPEAVRSPTLVRL